MYAEISLNYRSFIMPLDLALALTKAVASGEALPVTSKYTGGKSVPHIDQNSDPMTIIIRTEAYMVSLRVNTDELLASGAL